MPRGVAPALAILALLASALLAAPPAGAHPAKLEEGYAGLVHHEIEVKDSLFHPATLEARPLEHVNLTSRDPRQLHHIVAENGAFDSGVLHPGDSYDWTVTLGPGTYNFTCELVPSMAGKLVVGEPYPPNNPPVVTILSPEEGEKARGVLKVEGSADDPDQDWFRVRVRIDDGPWRYVEAGWRWSTSWDTTELKNGRHAIEAIAEDRWGELSAIERVEVEVENGKTETEGAPAIVITSPLPNARVSGPVLIEGIASPPSPDVNITIKVRIDDGAWKEVIGAQHWSLEWDSRTVKDGPHRIEAVATDGKRNSPTSSVNVLVQNSGTAQATIAILSPQERAKVSGVVELRGQADEPEGQPLRIYVRVDGGEWHVAEGDERWTFVWNSSLVGNGPHVLEAIARAPERASTIAKVTLFVDNGEAFDRPKVNITVPQVNQRLAGSILAQGRGSSAPGTTLTVEVRVDDGPWEPVSGTEKWAYTLNTTLLPNGVHLLHARSHDGRGHSEVDTVRFLVANAPRTFSDDGDDRIPVPRREPLPPREDDKSFLPAPSAAAALAVAAAVALASRRRRA